MKVRICHFVNIITGKSDGVYAHLKMIFKYSDKSKYEHYLIYQGNADVEKELNGLGVKVFKMDSINRKFSFKIFSEYYFLIKINKIDIIHSHLIKPYIIAGLANVLLKKKLIYNYHGLFINTEYYNFLEKIIYRIGHIFIYLFNGVSLAIVPSAASKEQLLKETKLFPSIEIYYNGYDRFIEEFYDPKIIRLVSEIKKNRYIVGIIARMEPEKRIDLAIKIVAGIREIRDDVYFLFMGEGSLEEEMRGKIKINHLESNAEILGFVPNAKLYIKYFDLLLNSSDREGLPISLWEAMANGVPVISTDAGGIKEIIEEVNCGILFPRGDADEAIIQLNYLLNDSEKRKQMGKKAVEAINKKYNGESFGLFINNLYSKLSHQNV